MSAATQIQPNPTALRAAVLSFGKTAPPPPPPKLHPVSITISVIPSPNLSRSSSVMAANIVLSPSNSSTTLEEPIPSVRSRTRLFQDSQSKTRRPRDLSTPRSRSLERGRVDASSLDDISSLRGMFEGSAPKKPPTVNASLKAALIATQRSPSVSRRTSPPPSPHRGGPVHKKSYSESAPPAPSTRPRPTVGRKPSALSKRSSSDSLRSWTSSSALTAATIAAAAAASAHASPTCTPQITGSKLAPRPPPPRTTRTPITDPPAAPKPTPPPVQPRNPAQAAAKISAANPPAPPISRSHTSDSTIAASLAPRLAHSPGPRKTPATPTPTSLRRRRSLPALPKTTLKATLRPAPKRTRSPSPQRPPHKLKSKNHAEALNYRWRWHITPRERRRYEGLWAANRGLHLPPEHRELVVGPVVRDIWRRSRLGFRTLGEIWALVDQGDKGCLSREEFCVGTWLVDMALRGGKVPVRIEDPVWECVRSLGVPR